MPRRKCFGGPAHVGVHLSVPVGPRDDAARLDHDDLGLVQSISIPMFRWIDIDVMDVIFSKS
jgi:hypothetical protein